MGNNTGQPQHTGGREYDLREDCHVFDSGCGSDSLSTLPKEGYSNLNNWDIYQSGLNILAVSYLVTLFTNPVLVVLNILMVSFFGWVVGAGLVAYALEGVD